MSYRKIRKYNSDIHIYEFNPLEERLSLELGVRGRLERVRQIGSPKNDEEIVCRTNAGFYNFDGSSEHLGLLISNGLYYSPPSTVFIDVIFDKNKKLHIEQVENNSKRLSWLQGNSIFSCGCSFSLVQNGVKNLENCGFFNHYIYRHPRTALGQKENGNIILCVVEGRSINNYGVTGNQLSQIMLDELCINAVNFDGGGSSVMSLGDVVVGGSERNIGSAFVVYKKKHIVSTNHKDIRTVTASALNIRNKPNLFGGKVGLYYKNNKIEILEEVNGWCRTALGWISSSYLRKG
jgi:hypothetical protein